MLTKYGYREIGTLVGYPTEIVVPFYDDTITDEGTFTYKAQVYPTGVQPVLYVETVDGKRVKTTKNHPFLVYQGSSNGAVKTRWVPAGELSVGNKLMMSNAAALENIAQFDRKWFALGHFSGDGWLLENCDGQRLSAGICASVDEQSMFDLLLETWNNEFTDESADFIESSYDDRYAGQRVRERRRGADKPLLQAHFTKPQIGRMLRSRYGFVPNTAPNKRFPAEYWYATAEQKASFLRGLFEADGHVGLYDRAVVTLTAANKEFARDAMTALNEFGVTSRVNTHSLVNRGNREQSTLAIRGNDNLQRFAASIFFENGAYDSKKVSKLLEFLEQRPKGEGNNGRVYSEIVSIEEGDPEPVFDMTVEHAHLFVAEGLVVHNCNLSEVMAPLCTTEEEFYDALELATIYSSTLALLPTHRPETNQVIARNRRIGVSLSGIAQWVQTEHMSVVISKMRNGYQLVKETNKWLAREAGVAESVRLTTTKPSGCWSPSSLVVTSDGILTFDEILGGRGEGWHDLSSLTVATRLGEQKVNKALNNGIVATKRLKTQDGLELETSLTHKLLTQDKNLNLVWREAQALEVGDKLVGHLGTYSKTAEPALIPVVVEPDRRTKGLNPPSHMNPDLAWVLGLFHGDGSVHDRGIRISCNRKDVDLVVWLVDFFKEQFDIDITIEEPEGWDLRTYVVISSRPLLEWLDVNGLLKGKSANTQVPRAIRESSTESIRAFISGLWRADGGQHSKSTWSVCTISKTMAQQLVVLGRAVGMNLKIANAGPGGWGVQDRWIVSSREVGDCNDRFRSKKMRERAVGDDLWLDEIVQVEDSTSLTMDLEVDKTHEYVCQGVVSHNSISLLAGVTPGVNYNPYKTYIRRVTVGKYSPVAPILIEAGIPYEDSVYDNLSYSFMLPIQTGLRRSQEDVSIWEQGMLITTVQKHWADNMVSNTIVFKEDEEEVIADFLSYMLPFNKSLSMLKLDTKAYPQKPYESITDKQYEELSKGIRQPDWSKMEGSDGEDDKFCTDDSCFV